MFEILRFITRDFTNDTLTNPVRDIFYNEHAKQIQFFHGGKFIFEALIGDEEYPGKILMRGNHAQFYPIKCDVINQDITSYDDTELLLLTRRSSDEIIKQLLDLQEQEYKTILDTIQEYKDNLI